jgi:hypothetical protein
MFEWYKVKHSPYIDYKIDIFLESLMNQCHCKFDDSGLFWIDVMISNYMSFIDELEKEIRNEITYKLISWALWRLVVNRTEEFEEFKFMSTIRSFSFTLFCKAWHREKIIAVEDIYITN